jgi:hypothetical protein
VHSEAQQAKQLRANAVRAHNAGRMIVAKLPDFAQYCEAACIRCWGEP